MPVVVRLDDLLHARHPRLIHVGVVGDTANPERPGHDLTYQADAGIWHPPGMPRVPVADLAGAVEALRQRARPAVSVVTPGVPVPLPAHVVGEVTAAVGADGLFATRHEALTAIGAAGVARAP